MPNGATERKSLALIERHIREIEESIGAMEALKEADVLTPKDEAFMAQERKLLETLYEQRLVILASWLPKHDPSQS